MAFTGRAVLFVEGEVTPHPRLAEPCLSTIWRTHLVNSLELIELDRVVGINKKNLIAMGKANAKKRQLSGVGMIGLDQRIARELQRQPFEVAVIAWDLMPPWDPSARMCRWKEVLSLYHGLSQSKVLPDNPWRRWVAGHYHSLRSRKKGQRNVNPPSLEPGAVLSVCMEPTFESLLIV